MTNFYEELNLNQDASVEDLNNELNVLENTWRRREITNPEKATKMLALIIDARKVFANVNTKIKYDNELKAEKNTQDADSQQDNRKIQFNKWFNEAEEYFRIGQNDLAKTAIEKALSYINVDDNNCPIYYLAASIYNKNSEYKLAIDYINKAIIDNPDFIELYLYKSVIYSSLVSVAKNSNRNDEALSYTKSQQEATDIAINMAKNQNNTSYLGIAYGAYAFFLYTGINPNVLLAEEYAKKAIELGDDWGNAQRVIQFIEDTENKKRQAEKQKKDAENQRIYDSAKSALVSNDIYRLQGAIKQFESISNYKDSKQQIKNIEWKIEQIQQDMQEERKKKIKKNIFICIGVLLLVILMFRGCS